MILSVITGRSHLEIYSRAFAKESEADCSFRSLILKNAVINKKLVPLDIKRLQRNTYCVCYSLKLTMQKTCPHKGPSPNGANRSIGTIFHFSTGVSFS